MFLAGRPIVEAYHQERSSDWVGILLCASVLHRQPNIDTDLLADIEIDESMEVSTEEIDIVLGDGLALRLQPATVPFHDSDSRAIGELSGYAVLPVEEKADLLAAFRNIVSATTDLRDLRLKAPQPRAQAKYQASLRWLEQVEGRVSKLANLYRLAQKREEKRAKAKSS